MYQLQLNWIQSSCLYHSAHNDRDTWNHLTVHPFFHLVTPLSQDCPWDRSHALTPVALQSLEMDNDTSSLVFNIKCDQRKPLNYNMSWQWNIIFALHKIHNAGWDTDYILITCMYVFQTTASEQSLPQWPSIQIIKQKITTNRSGHCPITDRLQPLSSNCLEQCVVLTNVRKLIYLMKQSKYYCIRQWNHIPWPTVVHPFQPHPPMPFTPCAMHQCARYLVCC